jgi:hypothetical protein
MKYFLIAFLLFIIIIYTIYDRVSYLYNDNNDNDKININNYLNKNNNKTNNNIIITYNNDNDKFNIIPIKNNITEIKADKKIEIKVYEDDEEKYYEIDNNQMRNKNVDDLLIKYSSIKNKLNTNEDYEKFYKYINTIRDSIYISILDNIVYDNMQLMEIIINDIQKTKLKYDFKKLKNIFIIKKINGNLTKLILFYDGLVYNAKKFKFVENNFMGNTIVYKLNINNKIINHYLQ